jgi:hypothetical protein
MLAYVACLALMWIFPQTVLYLPNALL